MSKWKNWKNKLTSTYYGRQQPRCEHLGVDIMTISASTGQPLSGICRLCKKNVKAKLLWERSDDI